MGKKESKGKTKNTETDRQVFGHPFASSCRRGASEKRGGLEMRRMKQWQKSTVPMTFSPFYFQWEQRKSKGGNQPPFWSQICRFQYSAKCWPTSVIQCIIKQIPSCVNPICGWKWRGYQIVFLSGRAARRMSIKPPPVSVGPVWVFRFFCQCAAALMLFDALL